VALDLQHLFKVNPDVKEKNSNATEYLPLMYWLLTPNTLTLMNFNTLTGYQIQKNAKVSNERFSAQGRPSERVSKRVSPLGDPDEVTQSENRIETRTGSHLFSETHPTTLGSYQVTWEGDFLGDGAVVGDAGSCGQNRKKLFLIVNRKEERKKERKEGRKGGEV